jgi:membrane protease YdiL (CAAX protease family)
MIVLIRGGAAGAVITVGLLLLGPDNLALQLVSIPLTNLPVLLLAQRHLFGPLDVGLARGLGLWPVTGGAGRFWLLVAATVAAGLLGEWGLGLAAERFRLSSHWTEWFDGDLVWGPAPVVLTGLVEYVLLAPLFEEVLFRGLLFATLRRRLGAWPAAAISATLFAAAHGYGLLGFASVFWSGLLWAWIYEKSGSLWPSLTAHALNNLLVCVTTILLLRE